MTIYVYIYIMLLQINYNLLEICEFDYIYKKSFIENKGYLKYLSQPLNYKVIINNNIQ